MKTALLLVELEIRKSITYLKEREARQALTVGEVKQEIGMILDYILRLQEEYKK